MAQNTFLSFKLDIDNSEFEYNADREKNSLLQIAKTIGFGENSVLTGWSIDNNYIQQNGQPALKQIEESSFWAINLNHISGSVLRLGVDLSSMVLPLIAYVPELSPIKLEGDTRNLSLTIDATYLLPILSVATPQTFFVVADTSGKGLVFYCNPPTSNRYFCILGQYIQQFCYPQNINSILNKLCQIYVSRTSTSLQVKYYDNIWQNGNINQGQISPTITLPSEKTILSPVLLQDNNEQPYGFINSQCLDTVFNNSFDNSDRGKILDGGNYIINFLNDAPFAFGWSPLNSDTVNPFYPTT